VKITLDPTPVVVSGASHCPVPESELLRLEREVANMISVAQERRRDVTDEAYEFRNIRDLTTTNPQKALFTAQRTHRRIGASLMGAAWVEYESTSKHLFSGVIKDAGCSNGGYLHLRTPLGESTGQVFASVNVSQRTNASLDVWVAARIPTASDRQRIKFKMGGQTMMIKGEPVSIYGSGFGWYNVGTTRLPSITNEFRVEVDGSSSTVIDLDCVLFTPSPFQPNNIRQPEFTFPVSKGSQKTDSDGI
jgi:hypothetical protein